MGRALRAIGRIAWWMARAAIVVAIAGVIFVWSLWRTVEGDFSASQVIVPQVTGLDEASATAALADRGLVLLVAGSEPSDTLEAGRVLMQSPSAESPSRRGREVRVVLSGGPVRIAAPQLVGRSRRESLIALKSSELSPGAVIQVHSARIGGEEVMAQVPAPGGVLDGTGKVDLLVSSGPRKIAFVMPDLRGRRLADAERLFNQVGVRIAEVKQSFTPGQAEGVVQSQTPERGSRILRETPIRLVVSSASPVPTSGGLPPGAHEE